jgi:hypothetical protein
MPSPPKAYLLCRSRRVITCQLADVSGRRAVPHLLLQRAGTVFYNTTSRQVEL